MSTLIIEGGHTLSGSLTVFGSKNAALPLLAASLLTSEKITLENIPDITDVQNMVDILAALGVTVQRDGQTIQLQAKEVSDSNILRDRVGQLRGSILLLGPLLARNGTVRLPRPGGDIIGARPIDTHLDAFRQLGGRWRDEKDEVVIDGSKLRSGKVTLGEFSVTATENVLLLAAGLPGTTTINIAAAEPHVVALAELLTAMGAPVTGAGTHTITVQGTSNLSGGVYTNIPDMLEAGLFILLAAAAQANLTVEQVPVTSLALFFKKLDEIGIAYSIDEQRHTVLVEPSSLHGFRMQALPHPGIATDLQAPFAVVATQAQGSSLIHDPLYEDRFKHIEQLQKMGGRAVVCDPHRVVIEGPTDLEGRKIPSLDIRSGATLVMAGLIARGQTIIEGAEMIDRGYEKLAARLRQIGAKISSG